MPGMEESAAVRYAECRDAKRSGARRPVAVLREAAKGSLQARYSLANSELDKPGDVVDVELVHDLTATRIYRLWADVDLSGDFFRRHAV